MAKRISYRKGYKYQLAEDYTEILDILPAGDVTDDTGLISLLKTGLLTVRAGYAWDGPSGPTMDSDSAMRASLKHDALYQLMRQRLLPPEARLPADKLLRIDAMLDGMYAWRAWAWYHALRRFGRRAADPGSKKKVYVSPKPRG